MPVSSNFRAISTTFLIAGLCACKPAAKAPQNPFESYDALSSDIGNLKVETYSIEDLPGDTRAEKLLYQAGIVSQMKTSMLVMFDTQAKTVRLSGNTKMADEIEANRGLMMKAVDSEIASMIKEAGLLYESYLSPEEIERLIVLHSEPVMQKLIKNQPKIAQGMLPIGEEFGLRVAARMATLTSE